MNKKKKKKINVAILFGGRSAEHEVSLQSAKNVFDAIDKTKYHPIPIGIDKTGKWWLYHEAKFLINANDPKLISLERSGDPVVLIPQADGQLLNLVRQDKSPTIDVVFPILHGSFGEDGTIQGLLKLANLPFVGASVLGSAVGMDKEVMKYLLREAKIPIGKFMVTRSHQPIPEFQKIKNELGLPFFIKPANMGSSVGVSKVSNEVEYTRAINKAFNFDTKIILEEFIQGREIECAVLGNENPTASVPGEIIVRDEFYSYDAKYIDEHGAILEIPAKLPHQMTKEIQQLAVKTFKILSCAGLGRVDFFLKDNKEIIVNEINTIPGFTKASMYPKLWQASGLSYTRLIDKLIQLALKRFSKEQKLKTVNLIN